MGSLGDSALLKKVKTHELEVFGINKALVSRISVLDDLLEAAYHVRCPEPSDHESRRELIRMFNALSKELYGNLCPVVAEFGSFVMNMFTSDSDLDLSINFNNRDMPRKERIQTLRRFSKKFRKLQNKRLVKDVQLVPTARVPVLKVTDCGTNIDCDFSVENRDGIAKSHLIFIIATIDERFRKLSLMLKVWAKTQGINSSRDGTLNSLSLILLAAFHLQCTEPPILPPFSALLRDGFDPLTVAKHVAPFVNYGQKNKQSLLQLFVTLLIRLKSVETLWVDGLCVSVTEGSWINKTFSKNRSLSVEDFTDRSQNVARAVQPHKAITIYESINKSLAQINSFVDGKIEGQMLETLLFGLCPNRLTKPVMTYDQSAPLLPVSHYLTPTNKMQPGAEKERTFALSKGVSTYYQVEGAPHNPVLHNPSPKKKTRAGKKKQLPKLKEGTSAPSKGNMTHDQSASLVLHPTPTKKKQLAVEKEGTSALFKGVTTHDQSATLVWHNSTTKEGTLVPSKGVMTRDQSATLVLHDPTLTKKKRLAVEKEGTLAPFKGVMTHDKSATLVLQDLSPAKKRRLAAEKEGALAPSKGAMTHDQSALPYPVLHASSPRKEIRMTAKKEGTFASSKDSRVKQPQNHVSSRTVGTSQGQGRLTQETEAFDRRDSYATQNPSRFMHGPEGMRAHERSFAPLFAHELYLSQSFVGFPYEASDNSALGFPAAIPNAPLHPPPRVVDGFPPVHDRSFDPYIQPVGLPEFQYPGQLSQTLPEHPYESGRPYRSYELDLPHRPYGSDCPHRPYELRHPHISYEPDRPLRSYEPDHPHRYEPDRPLRSYEPDRPHRPYELDRPHRPYDSDRPHRPYESDRPHRPYESDRPHRPYESDRPHRPYESDRPHRPYESDRPHRPYESDRPHRPYESTRPHRPYEPARPRTPYEPTRPHRSYESDHPYEAPRVADGPPFYW